MFGWHLWTWIWANSGRWWRTGKPGVLQFMGLQSQVLLSDWTATTASAVSGWPRLQINVKQNTLALRVSCTWGKEQLNNKMSLCLAGLPSNETRLCLHMRKGSFVFIWCALASVLEVHLCEAWFYCLSRTASPVSKGGQPPLAGVFCPEVPLCCFLDSCVLGQKALYFFKGPLTIQPCDGI